MPLTPQQRFGSNFSYDNSNQTITIELNDLTSGGDLNSDLGLEPGLLSFDSSSLDDRNARQILWALLLLSYYNQPQEVEEDSNYYLTVISLSPEITTKGSALFRKNSLEVSVYEQITDPSSLTNPSEIP